MITLINENTRLNMIFIITGPSGSGKTTLASGLVERCEYLSKVVTHTTRKQREGEVDGVHYHFVTEEAFNILFWDGALVEYAQVYGNYYGTSLRALQEVWDVKKEPVLVADIQGALWWKEISAFDVKVIFLMPPSQKELVGRISDRSDQMARLFSASEEINKCAEKADLVVPAGTIEGTLDRVEKFIIDQKGI